MPEQHIQSRRWHACQADETLRKLESSAAGLSRKSVQERLTRYGANRLDEAKPASVLQRLMRHLNNVLLYVLMASTTRRR